MFFVLFVLNDPNKMEPVLEAWETVGVGGVTIMHSSGLGRLRKNLFNDDIPLIPSISVFMEHLEEMHRTLFSVVSSMEIVDQLVKVTQEVIGDLENPETGLLVVLPVERVYGLFKKPRQPH
jgi:nitrogen regulatory protein PII